MWIFYFLVKDDYQVTDLVREFHTLYSTAQCLPTESLLRVINITHIDFFSLDIETVEEPVLENFPFNEITVDIWAIEHRRMDIPQEAEADHLNYTFHDLEKQKFPTDVIQRKNKFIKTLEHKEFILFMISKGYYYFDMTCAFVGDYIFVRKNSELFQRLKVPNDQMNRHEICKYKLLYSSAVELIPSMEELRDPHHYPELNYKKVD